MTPALRYAPCSCAARAQLGIDSFNDPRTGPALRHQRQYALQKTAPRRRRATRLLVRKLRPWNGRVPARLDWFAGRGVTPVAASTIDPRPVASDHAAIVVDVTL